MLFKEPCKEELFHNTQPNILTAQDCVWQHFKNPSVFHLALCDQWWTVLQHQDSHCLLLHLFPPFHFQHSFQQTKRLQISKNLDWYTVHFFNLKYLTIISLLEIFFNSTSSVLSYNNFDFGQIFSKDNQKPNLKNLGKERHEPTLFKQVFYFLLFTAMNTG